MRLLFLALAATLLASACNLTSSDREPGLEYSGAFANWFYQTNAVSIEAAAVQGALVEVYDDEGLRLRLRELATTQTNLNAQFTSVPPHPFWREYQPGIVEATRRFDSATAHLRNEAPFGPIEPLVQNFKLEEDTLLQAVIGCYTQAAHCPLPLE